jgi:hypothetical protein
MNSDPMTIEYRLTAEQLSNALDNTIRAFDEYSLRRKPDSSGRQVITDRSWVGMFHYFVTETTDGSRLSIEAKAAKSVPRETLTQHEELFLKNLFRIISKEIAVTPEMEGRKLNKKPFIKIGTQNIFWMIVILITVFKTFQV